MSIENSGVQGEEQEIIVRKQPSIKRERLEDGVIIVIILSYLTFVISQASLPQLHRFFEHISKLSIGL